MLSRSENVSLMQVAVRDQPHASRTCGRYSRTSVQKSTFLTPCAMDVFIALPY